VLLVLHRNAMGRVSKGGQRTSQRTIVQQQIRCDILHIRIVLDVHLRVQCDEQVQGTAEEEDDIESDEHQEDLVRH
jgi:hypothetical protein